MMHIRASGLGRRFHYQWVFRGLNLDVPPGSRVCIIGPNGGGKSTLLRMLAGQLTPTEGELNWSRAGKPLGPEKLYQHISWTSPGIEVYPELTLEAFYKMHFGLKTNRLAGGIEAAIEAINLKPHRRKELRHFSSGMLQRAKLGLALFSESDVVLLDEPTSFMDEQNVAFALQLIEQHLGNRTLLLASNLPREMGLAEQQIEVAAP